MSAQPPLPGFPPVPEKPRRRPVWETEMRRALAILADERARDRQRHADTIAMLHGQLADMRHRLADMERASGLSDLARAPSRNSDLRRFAGRLA